MTKLNLKNFLKLTTIFSLLLVFCFLVWIYLKFGRITYHVFIVNIQILINEFSLLTFDTTKDLSIMSSFFKIVLILPIGLTLIWSIIYFFEKINKKIFNFIYQYFFIFSALFLSVTIIIFFSKLIYFPDTKNIGKSNQDKFEKNFTKISDIKIENPQNLILIILESYDNDFIKELDQNLYNQINNLNFKKFNTYQIDNFHVARNATRSLTSQISYLCGIYLQLNKNNVNKPYFFKNHLCLQDIFNLNNYTTELLMNTPLTFQSSHRLYLKHYFKNIYDSNFFNTPLFEKNYYSMFNTINDEDLFLFAQKRLASLNKKNKNYFLTLMTLDTHGPGYYYDKDKCKKIIDNSYSLDLKFESSYYIKNKNLFSEKDINLINQVFSNISKPGLVWVNLATSDTDRINSFKCTNKHLINFLKYVDDSNFDANIVLVSDHNYHGGIAQRNLYNKIITKKKLQINQQNLFYSHDIFPTLLDLSGYQIKNKKKKIYLGNSVIGDHNLPEGRMEIINNIHLSHSKTYNELW
tara:strand:- start:990 stop:2552 length:1563 start_codon:yes stop_codon:yes gene_type:complete